MSRAALAQVDLRRPFLSARRDHSNLEDGDVEQDDEELGINYDDAHLGCDATGAVAGDDEDEEVRMTHDGTVATAFCPRKSHHTLTSKAGRPRRVRAVPRRTEEVSVTEMMRCNAFICDKDLTVLCVLCLLVRIQQSRDSPSQRAHSAHDSQRITSVLHGERPQPELPGGETNSSIECKAARKLVWWGSNHTRHEPDAKDGSTSFGIESKCWHPQEAQRRRKPCACSSASSLP